MKIPIKHTIVTITISRQKNMALAPAYFIICSSVLPACFFSFTYSSINLFSSSLRPLNIFSLISFFLYIFLAITAGSFIFFSCSSWAFFIIYYLSFSRFYFYYLFCLIALGSFCMKTSKLIAETAPTTTPNIILN